MNVDLALGVAIAVFAIWGAFSGAARQLAQAAAAVVAWLVASPVGDLVGPLVAKQLKVGLFLGTMIATLIVFVLIFLTVRLVVTAVVKRVLEGKDNQRKGLDRALGFLMGGVKAGAIGFIALCALVFVEQNVSVFGQKLDLSPKSSIAMKLAKEHNLFELAHKGELDELAQVVKMSKDPAQAKRLENSSEFQSLKKNPRFAAIAGQQQLWERVLATGDTSGLLKDDGLMQLLRDSDATRQIERVAQLAQH
jgi:membrane protein required for colicin V production